MIDLSKLPVGRSTRISLGGIALMMAMSGPVALAQPTQGSASRAAAPTGNARTQLMAVQRQLQQAQQLYAAKKYEAAGKIIGEAEQALAILPRANDFSTKAAEKKLQKTVTAAKAMLQKQGVTVTAPVEASKALGVSTNAQVESVSSGISFIKDIAPLFEKKCFHCHGGDETRARLRLVSYEGMQRGGNNGVLFRPGNAGNSLLLRRMKGEGEEEQMPPDADPFSMTEIALIEEWIQAGAPFDGGDPTENIVDLIAQFEVEKLSHRELWDQRALFVQKNWNLGMPGVASTKVETKNLRLMGTDATATMESVATDAETRIAMVADLIGAPSDRPLIKGGVTIYVVTRRYDYAEFGKMVEQRALPRGSYGHWRYNGRDAYGVILCGKGDEFGKDVLLAEQVAGLALASRGVPDWFAQGAGLSIAGRLDHRDARILKLRAQAKEAVRNGVPAQKFLENDLSPEQSRLIGFAFVERLMASKKRWTQLMNAIAGNEDFESAFSTAYRGTPEKLLADFRGK